MRCQQDLQSCYQNMTRLLGFWFFRLLWLSWFLPDPRLILLAALVGSVRAAVLGSRVPMVRSCSMRYLHRPSAHGRLAGAGFVVGAAAHTDRYVARSSLVRSANAHAAGDRQVSCWSSQLLMNYSMA
jgi:hypothetical protein